MFKELRIQYRMFIYGVKNLIKWFPIIWKDRDWDSYYTFEILAFKIKKQADYLEKENRHLGVERDVEIMRTCLRLIDKIQGDFYELEYQDYYEQFFNFDIPGGTMTSKVIRDNLKEYFNKYPNDFRKVIVKDPVNNIRIALVMGDNRTLKAQRILFNLLDKNINNWWN